MAIVVPYEQAFLHALPDVLKADRIAGGCMVASILYAARAQRAGVGIIYLLGHRRRYPRRHPMWSCYPNPDPDFYHVANTWRGHFIDWTYRQFDPAAPVPFVATATEMRRLWRVITTTDPTD